MEEVFDHVADERLGSGHSEVGQRLAGRPRLPCFILSVLVLQALLRVQYQHFDHCVSDIDENYSSGRLHSS